MQIMVTENSFGHFSIVFNFYFICGDEVNVAVQGDNYVVVEIQSESIACGNKVGDCVVILWSGESGKMTLFFSLNSEH